MGGIAGAGVGVATAINPAAGVAVGVVNALNLGPKYTKANHVQRFITAQAGGDYNTARTLVDQAYQHAYLQDIPDKADWVNIYQQIVQLSNPTMRDYENTKSGAGKTGTGTTGQGATVATPPASTMDNSPTGGISLVWLGIIFLAAGAAAWFFLKRRK